MQEQHMSDSSNTGAICSRLLTPDERPAPATAPLIKVEVEVNLTIDSLQAGDEQTKLSTENALQWFRFEDIPQFASPSALLLCRVKESLMVTPTADGKGLNGLLGFHFSVHPMKGRSIQKDTLQSEVEKAIKLGLRSRLKHCQTMRSSFTVTKVLTDPGLIPSRDAYIGYLAPGSPRIVLGKTYDWDVKTCHLTGEHFFQPAPLGFFYDGDPAKPVSPTVALKQGFTVSVALLLASASQLNSAQSLIELPGDIAVMDYHVNNFEDGTELQFITNQWGGAVNTFYRTVPEIDPRDIPDLIAVAKAAPRGSKMEAVKAVLRTRASERPVRPAFVLPQPVSTQQEQTPLGATTGKPQQPDTATPALPRASDEIAT